MGDAVIPVHPWRRTTDYRGRTAWVMTDPTDDTREVWVVVLDDVPVWRYVAVRCPAGALRTESWADHYHLTTSSSLTVAAKMAVAWLYGDRLAPLAWEHLQRTGGLPEE